MRIAQLMLAKRFGGAERAFVDLCRALAARGHTLLAIGEARGEALGQLDACPHVECVRVTCRGVWDPWCRHVIARHLRAFRPDIVQAHLARAAAFAGPCARALGVPSIAKTHNLVKPKYYRAIDLLVPTTREQHAHLVAAGVPDVRLQRIPNFRALDAVAVAKTPPARGARVKTLGRFVAKKGFDVLLRAAALAARDRTPWQLEIAGDGPERAALHALAGELGIRDRVSFPGWVDDVEAYLANADLFVLPSRIEPFGIALLEAMATGVPIVATRVSGPLEILDERSAFFADPGDAAALSGAVAAALGSPGEAHARAQAALARFSAHYAEDVVVQHYLDAYAGLLRKA